MIITIFFFVLFILRCLTWSLERWTTCICCRYRRRHRLFSGSTRILCQQFLYSVQTSRKLIIFWAKYILFNRFEDKPIGFNSKYKINGSKSRESVFGTAPIVCVCLPQMPDKCYDEPVFLDGIRYFFGMSLVVAVSIYIDANHQRINEDWTCLKQKCIFTPKIFLS